MLFKSGHSLKFCVYSYFKRNFCCSSICHAEKNSRRQYVRKFLHVPTIANTDANKCQSQNMFLNSDIIFHTHAGVFTYLPLGLRALEKLTHLIDEEMQDIGAQKIAMPTLIKSSLWKKTERWETEELFKILDRHNKEYCLGPTHEEVVTSMIADCDISSKMFPLMLYQITKKFRDEKHPKHGLLRGREFEMKDMYTFDSNEKNAMNTYYLVCDAYCRIFDRLGVQYMMVEGSTGNIGGSMSHEFHIPASVGEDSIYMCNECGFGTNKELISEETLEKEDVACSKCEAKMTKFSGIEVGHAFLLGTKYSDILEATFQDGNKNRSLQMGCYGLGVSRILQASVEVLSKDENIRWPSLIAPFQVCIIPQMGGYGGEKFTQVADELSDVLTKLPNLKNEVVIDDRVKLTVGNRMFAAMKHGYPYIVVVGKKCLVEPKLYEVIDTITDNSVFMTLEQVIEKFKLIQTI